MDTGSVKRLKNIYMVAVAIFMTLLVFTSNIHIVNAEEGRAKIEDKIERSDTKDRKNYQGTLNYEGRLTFPGVTSPDKDVEEVQYRSVRNGIGNKHGDWKVAKPNKDGSYTIKESIRHIGYNIVESVGVQVWVKYYDDFKENVYSYSYELTSTAVKKVGSHNKGIDINNDTVIDGKYEFIPQWNDETYLEIIQPSGVRVDTVKGEDKDTAAGYSPYYKGFLGKLQTSVVGTKFIYHNIGKFKGETISLQATIKGYKERGKEVVHNRQLVYGDGGKVSINTVDYDYTDHEWKFISEETGKPVKITGYITFVDLDGRQGIYLKDSDLNKIDKVYATQNTTVRMADDLLGTYIFTPFRGNILPEDPDGWVTLTFEDLDTLRFSWTWEQTRLKGDGYIGYINNLPVRVKITEPNQYVEADEGLLKETYTRYNPKTPTLTFVTEHFLHKQKDVTRRYEISAEIPEELKVNSVSVKDESGKDYTSDFIIDTNKKTNEVKASAKSYSLKRDDFYAKRYYLEVNTEVEDLEKELSKSSNDTLTYKVRGKALRNNENKYTDWATGILKYTDTPVIPEPEPEPEPDPEPEDQVGGTYTGRHVNSETGKRLVMNDRGYLSPGQSYTLRSKSRIYGHRYTGRLYYKGVGYANSSSQTVRKLELSESEIRSGVTSPRDKHEVWFYYDYINIPYEVEYRNVKTGDKIHPTNAGEVNVDNPYIARPVDVKGYNYTGRYDFNRVSTRGSATLVRYEEGRRDHKIVYYYELEDPDNTHKDFDEYDSMEAYTNVGLVTKRKNPSDAINGHDKKEFGEDVLETKVNANTTAVLDKYKSPIAIEPIKLSLKVKDSKGTTEEVVRNTAGEKILNTDYVDGLRIQKTIGYGQGDSTTRVKIAGRSGYLDMEDGAIKSVDQARREALGASGSTLGTDREEKGYYGRWLGVSDDVIDLEEWTPTRKLSANVERKIEEAKLDKVTTSIEYKVHNILKHNYVTRRKSIYNPETGKYGFVEYYEYKDTDILEGFYRDGNIRSSIIEFNTEVDTSGIKVGEMLNAEGFKVENNKLSTTKHLVAREKFTSNGTKYTGHETLSESQGNGRYNNLVESDRDGKTGESYLTKELDYYEEFGYLPYSVSDEDLMTQQAVPVGGKITYINPYDYFVLPSAVVNSASGKGSAIDSSRLKAGERLVKSETIDKVSRNVGSIKRNGLYTSVMPYNKTNSGFYTENVDEFNELGIEGIGSDKGNMQRGLGSAYSPVRANTRYTHRGLELGSGSALEYKQPIRFDGEKSQVRLRNRVLVGRMTGYPVVIDAQEELDIEKGYDGDARNEEFVKRYADLYEEAYEREFGYKPTKYDKALSGNGEITWYYLPLEKEKIRKNDKFGTRLVINGIGTSQFNLVEDHKYGFEKFLYGSGEDVIFSGQRESFTSFEDEAGLGETSIFNQDIYIPQIIDQGKQSKETDQINGIRTRNNSIINKDVLKDEVDED